MVKVLIYSSKELYNTSSYEGRAEADLVAYRVDEYNYEIVKNRFVKNAFVRKTGTYPSHFLEHAIEEEECIQFKEEVEAQ